MQNMEFYVANDILWKECDAWNASFMVHMQNFENKIPMQNMHGVITWALSLV